MEFIWDFLGNYNITETVFQFMLVNAILGLSIYLTLYTGMFSLAQAGFMGIGAYVGVLTTQALPGALVAMGVLQTEIEISLWIGVITGALAAGLIAIPVGLPALRLRDIYLAIATIGFGEIVRELIKNFDNIVRGFIVTFTEVERSRFTLLEGARGLKGIPKLTETWHLVLFIAIMGYFLVRLRRSRLGRAMSAIRQDEQAAANMGIDVVFVKNLVFVLSAMVAGAAGAFSGHLTRIITPDAYGFTQAVDILAYAVLGGTTAWFGPIIGGMIMGALPEVMRVANEYRGFMVGLVLWAVIVFLPGGIIGIPGMIARVFQQERPAPVDDPLTAPPESAGD